MTTAASSLKYWVLFLISLSIMVFLLATATEWFWLALPTTVTYFVRGMKWI